MESDAERRLVTDQIPFVLERDAAGATADIFADIKAIQRVAMVYLIWRHLAVVPAQLERAWQAARPIYMSARSLLTLTILPRACLC